MKKILLLSSIIFFLACAKNESIIDSLPLTEPITGHQEAEDFAHRGIYINDFEDDILGDLGEENYLFNWCLANDFNEITLYNVSSILNDAGQTALLYDFVERAHADHDLRVSFVAASNSAINKIDDYNSAYPDSLHAPNGIATEYEFWNNPNNFDYYKEEMMKRMAEIDPNFDSTWHQQFYISKFKDKAEEYTDEEVLHKVLGMIRCGGGNDELFWVNYRNNAVNFPNPTSAPNSYGRIQDIANEAHEQGIIVNLVILFNVRTQSNSPNIYDFFDVDGEDHDYYEAFENYKEGYDLSGIEHKENINMEGYQIYRYSNARLARPL